MTDPRIPDHQLLSYAAGELPPEEARKVEAALASDHQAARAVSVYRLARRATASDDSAAPPAATIARLKSLFKPRSEVGGLGHIATEWLRHLDRTIGGLIYDSRLQPATVRSASAAVGRFHLTYEAGDVDVDLQAEPAAASDDGAAGDRWRLIGQISTAAALDDAEVAACPAGLEQASAAASCDARGIFTMDLPADSYDLHVRIGESVVTLREIELR